MVTKEEFDQILTEAGYTSGSFRNALWDSRDAFLEISAEELERHARSWKERNPRAFEICNSPENDSPEKQKECMAKYGHVA